MDAHGRPHSGQGDAYAAKVFEARLDGVAWAYGRWLASDTRSNELSSKQAPVALAMAVGEPGECIKWMAQCVGATAAANHFIIDAYRGAHFAEIQGSPGAFNDVTDNHLMCARVVCGKLRCTGIGEIHKSRIR